MKEKMKNIINSFHKYNSENMAYLAFGLDNSIVYDVLVVAPSYTPYKFKLEDTCQVTTLKEGSYIAGYLVEKDDLKIAWVKFGSSDSNLIDHVAVCTELKYKKMVFIGAVGALKAEFELGEICTPSYSIAGSYAHTYLKESIKDYVPFEKVEPDMAFVNEVIALGKETGVNIKKASVFCTASIALEYYHLDEIKEFETDLIEMETACFYLMADLLEIQSVALLVVSDNSATNTALVGRTEKQQRNYQAGFKKLCEMIFAIAKM